MAEYYFLASLLPELEIGHVPALSFSDLKELMRVNLEPEDKERVRRFLRLIDLENLRRIFAHEPIDPHGNFTEAELIEALVTREFPPNEEFSDLLNDYLERYKSDEERVAHFTLLMGGFLQKESEEESGFLQEFFTFEREMRIVIAGFRAKKLHKNIEAAQTRG